VHTVFRSSGLAGTLLTGWMLYKRKYSAHQILSCLLVCVGICLLTVADATAPKAAATTGPVAASVNVTAAAINSSVEAHVTDSISATPPLSVMSAEQLLPEWLQLLLPAAVFSSPLLHSAVSWAASVVDVRWLVGICMLSVGLLTLAVLGFEQERTYALYGKDTWREVVFYMHLVSLPFCLAMSKDIAQHAQQWMQPESYLVVQLPAPLATWWGGHSTLRVSMYLLLAANLLTQSVSIKGVSMLTAHSSSALVLSLALTLRKFLSLLLSIACFSNAFTSVHWAGAGMVFAGIAAYGNENVLRRLLGLPLAKVSKRPEFNDKGQNTATLPPTPTATSPTHSMPFTGAEPDGAAKAVAKQRQAVTSSSPLTQLAEGAEEATLPQLQNDSASDQPGRFALKQRVSRKAE